MSKFQALIGPMIAIGIFRRVTRRRYLSRTKGEQFRAAAAQSLGVIVATLGRLMREAVPSLPSV